MKSRRFVTAAVLLGLVAALTWRGIVHESRERFEDQYLQALTALEERDLDRVSEVLASLEREPRFQHHAELLRGALHLRRGRLEEALGLLAPLVSVTQLREPAMSYAGECLYRLGHLIEAEALMRHLATERPDNANAHRVLGGIYYDLGANDLAIAELKTVVRLDPDDYAVHRLLGLMYFDFEQHKEAIHHYRRSLALDPPAAVRERIVEELAQSMIQQRQYGQALELLEEATASAVVLTLQAECHWSLGRPREANKLLRKARSLDPAERATLLLEARMLMAEGRREAAIQPLKEALRNDPHDAECRYQLAQIYQRLGRTEDYERESARWEASRKLRERLTELNLQAIQRPGDADVRSELAGVCEELDMHKHAEMWRQAAQACRELAAGRQPSSSAGQAVFLLRALFNRDADASEF